MENIMSIVLSILGSSLVTVIITTVILQPWQDKKKYVFDEKKARYDAIIVFAQAMLFPAEAKYALHISGYDMQRLDYGEIRKRAIDDLKMEVAKLKLITKDDELVEELKKLIRLKNEDQFNVLVDKLRRDLYK